VSGDSRIVAGGDLTCGVTARHIAYCWCSNIFGQIGDGTAISRNAYQPRGSMLKRAAFLVAVTLFLTGTAGAQEKKTDVTGKWLFSVTTDAGTGTPTITLKQSSDSLSGHYSSQLFGEIDFKGSIKEKAFTFAFTANVQGTSFTVTYKGTVEADDALKGTVDLGGQGGGTFTAKKQ
jgi:hypothetical protein